MDLVKRCLKCSGTGKVLGQDLGGDYAKFPTSTYECHACDGKGVLLTQEAQSLLEIVCPQCQGTKEVAYPGNSSGKKTACSQCRGHGGGWSSHAASTGKVLSPFAEALLELVETRLKVQVLNEDCDISRK